MNFRRIKAIFIKDVKDFMKNMNISLVVLLAPLFALFYTFMFNGEELSVLTIYILISVAFTGIATTSLAMIIAEEKEKKTLQNLVQSPASGLDIMIGKSLVTLLMTLISAGVSLLIVQPADFWSFPVIVSHILLLVFFLSLGIFIGLLSSTVGTVNVYSIIQMLAFMMSPSAELIIQEEGILRNIISYFPFNQAIKAHNETPWENVGIIAIWTAVIILFTIFTYSRKSFAKKLFGKNRKKLANE